MKTPLAIILLTLAATPAHAEWMTGGQLADVCTSDKPIDRGLCLSYIMGVLDQARALDAPFRAPDDVSGGAVRVVVTDYLTGHPQTRDAPARLAVQAAIKAAWPQPKPAAKPKPAPKPPRRKPH
ncbi:MAG: hypothetical protein RIS94_1357 [Pseudomonadota bacterium]|jgi:hypothetical protein